MIVQIGGVYYYNVVQITDHQSKNMTIELMYSMGHPGYEVIPVEYNSVITFHMEETFDEQDR